MQDGADVAAGAPEQLPVVLIIDLEPDPIIGGGPSQWDGPRHALDTLMGLRPQLEELTNAPVAFSWMVRADSHIGEHNGDEEFGLRLFRSDLEECREVGDLIGIHVHVFGPGHEYEDWTDDDLMLHELEVATSAFDSVFSRVPDGVGFARGFTTDGAVRHYRERGIRFDLSTVADSAPPTTSARLEVRAALPDLTMLPRRPYAPSPDDWRVPDHSASDGPLIVPLTAVRTSDWRSRLELVRGGRRYRQHLDAVRKGYLLQAGTRRFAASVRTARSAGMEYLTLSARSNRFLTESPDQVRTRLLDISRRCDGGIRLVSPDAIARHRDRVG